MSTKRYWHIEEELSQILFPSFPGLDFCSPDRKRERHFRSVFDMDAPERKFSQKEVNVGGKNMATRPWPESDTKNCHSTRMR